MPHAGDRCPACLAALSRTPGHSRKCHGGGPFVLVVIWRGSRDADLRLDKKKEPPISSATARRGWTATAVAAPTCDGFVRPEGTCVYPGPRRDFL